MTRSEERAEAIRAGGARVAVADALDREAVRRAMAEAAPEAVVHQLTDLPQDFSMRYRYGDTSRLRTEGTQNLLDGAREAGARRVGAPSTPVPLRPPGGAGQERGAAPAAGSPGGVGGRGGA